MMHYIVLTPFSDEKYYYNSSHIKHYCNQDAAWKTSSILQVMMLEAARYFATFVIIRKLTLPSLFLMCSWKFNLMPKIIPQNFLWRDLLLWIIVKVNGRMTHFLQFTGGYDFLGLFASVRVKTPFPLERPVGNFP